MRQHTLFLSRALEWERQQKQSRYLLVGDDLKQAESWLKLRFQDEQLPCIPTDLHCEFITESIKNSQNLMTQVFLSYAGEELAVMEKVRRSLRREGFTVWTNKTDIQTGVDFQEAINRGVEEADNLVYLLSPASLRSPYCHREIDYALSLNKRIIPLLVQPTDPEQMPPVLRGLQFTA